MTTLFINDCFYDLFLYYRSHFEFFLPQIFKRGFYVIHGATQCLPRGLSLVEGVIETASQIFPSVHRTF
eukprot:UN08715